MTRRLLPLFLLLLLGYPALHAQTSPIAAVPLAERSDEGARALWGEFMDRLLTEYYEPLEENQLTRQAIDALASESTLFTDLPKPTDADYGTTAPTLRVAFHNYVLRFAARAGRKLDSTATVELAIQRVCERHLKFAHYIPSSVQAELANLGKADLGMRVEARENGRYYCQPFDGGAAAQAGIQAGDELVSLDGVELQGMSRWKVKVRLYGSEGSKADVGVRLQTGRTINAQLTRHISPGLRITSNTDITGTTVRIPTFDSNTVSDLRDALQKVKPSLPLTLDLRGNGGGEIPPAIDAAALFIDAPRPLVLAKKYQRGQPEPKDLASNIPAIPGFKRLLILMDGGTASSAEIFIEALLEVPALKVSLSGERSYGKDSWQSGATLKNGGGELLLPMGHFTTVSGKAWGKGIEPTVKR